MGQDGADSAPPGSLAQLAGPLHRVRDAVDARSQCLQNRAVLAAAGAPALEQIDLQEADRIDVRIPQANRTTQRARRFESAIQSDALQALAWQEAPETGRLEYAAAFGAELAA